MMRMRKYFEIAKISFKSQLVWRFDVAMSALSVFVKILFAFILWGAIFGQKDTVSGFTFTSMLSYYLVSSLLSQLDLSGKISSEISGRIRDGTFSKFMVIPANTRAYFLAQTFGCASFYLIFDLLMAGVCVVAFHIHFSLTTDFVTILCAIFMVVLGLIFMAQLNYFLGILVLKFQDISLFLMIKDNIVALITGTMIPLTLLPAHFVSVMRIFPFYYVTYLPAMLLIGRNSGEALAGLMVLFIWVSLFLIINKLTYNQLRVRYDGVGI